MLKLVRISLIALPISSILMLNCAFSATVTLPRTGQTICYDWKGVIIGCSGTGQDGDKQKGAAWPIPRFIDNTNGTVSDNLTGLIWLKNANCFGRQLWGAAMTSASNLTSGSCGLNDGSVAGQWRLPNRKELVSLANYFGGASAIAVDPSFTSVQDKYWTSSTHTRYTYFAWFVYMGGGVDADYKEYYYDQSYPKFVWPVRGGQ